MEMDYENRMVSADYLPEDEGDNPLRPQELSDYIGQTKVKENLSVFINAAKLRGEALDHVLLYGPCLLYTSGNAADAGGAADYLRPQRSQRYRQAQQ